MGLEPRGQPWRDPSLAGHLHTFQHTRPRRASYASVQSTVLHPVRGLPRGAGGGANGARLSRGRRPDLARVSGNGRTEREAVAGLQEPNRVDRRLSPRAVRTLCRHHRIRHRFLDRTFGVTMTVWDWSVRDPRGRAIRPGETQGAPITFD